VNFDLIIISGYALGEYVGVTVDDKGNPMAAWGDCRNSWVSPANGFYAGVHPQTDVFFVRP
jgi:type IV secretory pathway protease TraF